LIPRSWLGIEYTPLGDLRSELQDSYALLVTDRGGELIHTPLQPPENNVLIREGHFTLHADNSLSGEVLEKRRGDHALWERYAGEKVCRINCMT
jgi:hypothetical protein